MPSAHQSCFLLSIGAAQYGVIRLYRKLPRDCRRHSVDTTTLPCQGCLCPPCSFPAILLDAAVRSARLMHQVSCKSICAALHRTLGSKDIHRGLCSIRNSRLTPHSRHLLLNMALGSLARSIRSRTQPAPPSLLSFSRCAGVTRRLTVTVSSPAFTGGRPWPIPGPPRLAEVTGCKTEILNNRCIFVGKNLCFLILPINKQGPSCSI